MFSIYGYFCVHRSRCLIFRNGRLPEHTTNAIYRYWGIPEYVKIKRALRECITSHEDGVKLLERSVQAIYKMKNLANMLSTEDGENKVLQRLQVIDMARGILNSIAIDTDGEDYDFKTLQMSGIKDVIDATCNMLSAVTDIPQTILFGRSPAGMNSTGESDFENYYNMVENIQKQNMKANARTVIDLILKQGALEGAIPEVPKYKMKFAALWSMSDTEKANVEQTKAQTEYTKAQTAQIYMDSNALDPSEVRKSLASEGGFEIEEVISDNDLDLPDDVFDLSQTADAPDKSIFSTGDLIEIAGTDIDKKKDDDSGIISIEVVGTGDEEINIEEQIDIELPNEDGEDFPEVRRPAQEPVRRGLWQAAGLQLAGQHPGAGKRTGERRGPLRVGAYLCRAHPPGGHSARPAHAEGTAQAGGKADSPADPGPVRRQPCEGHGAAGPVQDRVLRQAEGIPTGLNTSCFWEREFGNPNSLSRFFHPGSGYAGSCASCFADSV